ncbi:MAG: prepilin-type N-terminal cleavage/methylation domain-containing protein [Planctomycetota bacterium]
MLNQRRPTGFSMIELLVVLFLIAFMIAFMTKVFIDQTRGAKIKAARILIHKLDIALHEYYSDHGEYPPDTGYGLDPAKGKSGSVTLYDTGSLYRYLGRPLTILTGPKKGTYGPYIQHFDSKELKSFDGGPETDNNYMVVDPWFTPIGYIGSRARVLHNRDGVDLFSAGPDRKTASDKDSGEHGIPSALNHDNNAYDGNPANANAVGLGKAAFNGALTQYKKDKNITASNKKDNEVLDDVNNWDPES